MPRNVNSRDFLATMEQMRRKSRAGSDALRRNFRVGRTDEPQPQAQLRRPCQCVQQSCRPCSCPCSRDKRDSEGFTEEFHERQVDYVRTKREDV